MQYKKHTSQNGIKDISSDPPNFDLVNIPKEATLLSFLSNGNI